MFVKILIVKESTKQHALDILKEISALNNNEMELDMTDIYATEIGADTMVRLNFSCVGSDELSECFSLKHSGVVLFLQIYDGDFWEYMLFKDGDILDRFCPVPDYFDDLTEDEMALYSGKPEVMAHFFDVQPCDIEKYFIRWTDDISVDYKAYDSDEFGCEDWQMADFMDKIGFSYDMLD